MENEMKPELWLKGYPLQETKSWTSAAARIETMEDGVALYGYIVQVEIGKLGGATLITAWYQ